MAGMEKFRLVPLLLPTVSYCLGIVSGQVCWNIWFWLIITGVAALISVVLLCLVRQYCRVCFYFLLLSFLGFGGFRAVQSEYYYENDHIARYCQGDGLNVLTVCGKVTGQPVLREHKGKLSGYDFLSKEGVIFDLNCNTICLDGGKYDVSGIVRVSTSEPALHIASGDVLEITGKVYLRSRQDGDTGNYIRRNRILVGMYVDHNELINKIQSSEEHLLFKQIDQIRDRLTYILTEGNKSGSESGAVLSALLLGERDGISKKTNDAFLRTGTMHYLSLSGLHVAMLTGFLWLVLRLTGLPRFWQGFIPMIFVCCYMILVPHRPPIFRAGLIMIMFCIAYMMRRSSSALNLLAFSCLVYLVIKPLNFYDVGFQLSYGVVIALLIISPDLFIRVFEDPTKIKLVDRYSLTMLDTRRWYEIWRDRVVKYLLSSVAVSCVACMVSLPLICHYFNRVSWLAPFNSVVLALPVTAAMAAGVMKIILYMFWPLSGQAAAIFNAPADWLVVITRFLGDLSFSSENTGTLPGWFNMLYFALVILLLYFAYIRRYFVLKSLVCVWLLLIVVMVGIVEKNVRGVGLQVHFLPVGHGCCAVCRLPDSGVIVYDCGSYDDFNLVENRVMPNLRELGINHIDVLIVSHLDIDHYSGVPDLLDSISVGRVLMPVSYCDDITASDREYLQMVMQSKVDIGLLRQGNEIVFPGGTVEVLWPEREEYDKSNNGSVVAKISDGKYSVLLCGDIEPDSIRGVIDSGANLDADYILLPHHGQYSDELVELVEKVSPKCAVVSGRQLTGKRKEQLASLAIEIRDTGEGVVVVLK